MKFKKGDLLIPKKSGEEFNDLFTKWSNELQLNLPSNHEISKEDLIIYKSVKNKELKEMEKFMAIVHDYIESQTHHHDDGEVNQHATNETCWAEE